MRKGEILNLTRNKVDLKKRHIRLEAIDTKTGEPRTCSICDELYRVLKRIPRAIHDPHVFLYEGKPIKDIKTAFKALCEKAGVDKETIKAITGHNTDSMFTRYNKLSA